jgi:hypothetical protein
MDLGRGFINCQIAEAYLNARYYLSKCNFLPKKRHFNL